MCKVAGPPCRCRATLGGAQPPPPMRGGAVARSLTTSRRPRTAFRRAHVDSRAVPDLRGPAPLRLVTARCRTVLTRRLEPIGKAAAPAPALRPARLVPLDVDAGLSRAPGGRAENS